MNIGDTVGDYRITGILGRGGMGAVYQVEHAITRRVEAMKVMAHSRPDASEERLRFLREIQVQASLSHPNIAAVHNAFWNGDELLLVMERVEGDSLRALLERGPVPLPAALGYVAQTLEALRYAHARGVVHRDITPANIIVTAGSMVKLTDFGLARQLADPRLTQTGALVGSPAYMSPEQIQGTAQPDARSDIYSLGVVLYELATGRRPFASDSAFAVMLAHAGKEPLPPIGLEPEIGEELNEVILKALAKEPARRFQTAQEFREALERARPSAGRWRERPRSRAARLGFAAAFVIALLLPVAWRAPAPRRAPPVKAPPAPFITLALPETVRLPAVVPPAVEEVLPEPTPPRKAPARRLVAAARPRPAHAVTPEAPAPRQAEIAAAASPPQPPQQATAAAQPDALPPLPQPPEKKAEKKRNRLWRAVGKVLPPWK